MKSYILLVDCSDEKGIVHKVTGAIYRQGLNIDDQAEFVEKSSNHFFMRTEISGSMDSQRLLSELNELALSAAKIQLSEKRKKSIVILGTTEPHCLGDLLLRHAYGELRAQILAVLSNRRDLEPLVAKFCLPFDCVPHENISREEHEAKILEVLQGYAPEYVVLAKFMRILSPAFVSRYPNRIINIHHSFLPAFAGAKPYHQAHERGVKIIGATAHFVTEKLDEGPIIAQNVIPIDHSKTISEMRQAGRDVEKFVLANALKLVFEDRVFIHKNRTVIFD